MPRCTIQIILLFGLTVILTGCPPARRPIPPGVIPKQHAVSTADELYGHEVLSRLVQRYPLDHDDARIKRVRDIVDRITAAAGLSQNPWHVYVLSGDGFQNAAATRGNYIFVWTGMLNTVKNDEELAVALAHEIGHSLAGHTKPTPAEEVNAKLAGIVGGATREVVYGQGGAWVLAADLAGALLQEAVKAMLVNPEERRKELEADRIGLFLLAEGGYDPQVALDFWERMKNDPGFAGFPIQFLSTHPSSEERIKALKEILPQAKARWAAKYGGLSPEQKEDLNPRSEWVWDNAKVLSGYDTADPPAGRPPPINDFKIEPPAESKSTGTGYEFTTPAWVGKENIWEVRDAAVYVYPQPDSKSGPIGRLMRSTQVAVESELPQRTSHGRWLHIVNPLNGYVLSPGLAPVKQQP